MSGRGWIFCGRRTCTLCGSNTLPAWSTLHGFPTVDSGLPYSLDGPSLTGTTIYGDITSDGTSFGRSGSGDLGGGINADTSLIVFPVVARDCTVSYEYEISAGGKHRLSFLSGTALSSAQVMIGSWSSDFSNTVGDLGAGVNQLLTSCVYEAPAELSILPQTSGVWRTRTFVKTGRTILVTDGGTGPIPVTRCFFPVRGYVALTLGPGVRVKNLSVS
jgi:hypothetical protein